MGSSALDLKSLPTCRGRFSTWDATHPSQASLPSLWRTTTANSKRFEGTVTKERNSQFECICMYVKSTVPKCNPIISGCKGDDYD
jgi:hypothetical protein